MLHFTKKKIAYVTINSYAGIVLGQFITVRLILCGALHTVNGIRVEQVMMSMVAVGTANYR